MNAQATIAAATSATSDKGLPMPRATLESIERQRDRALASLLDGFDGLAAGIAAAREASQGIAVTDYTGRRSAPALLSEAAQKALLAGDSPMESYDKRNTGCETWREAFEAETRKTVDRAVWSYIIEATDLEKLMDRQAREEFAQSMATDPPAPTVENVRATLGHYMAEAPTILKRGLAKAFASLDRRFRSHDGFKVGSRVILDYLFTASGFRNHGEKTETLRDIERAFMILDDRPHPESYAGIVGLLDGIGYSTPRPVVVESDWVRIRVFKNGNAHLWFKRDDMVRKVNRLLADYYGEAIGEGSDVCDTSDLGPQYHLTPARNLGFYETSPETARALFERASISYYAKQRAEIGGRLRILEPSAGNGALADPVRDMGAAVECIEMDTGRAAVLRAKGHSVTQRDFLTMSPTDFAGGLFDGVVMNPPFDRGRDCDHVRHALQFVKPGGFVLAIMSASAEVAEDKRRQAFRAHLAKTCSAAGRYYSDRWFQDLPEGSFAHAGTMVNAVTLCAYIKEA